MIGGGYMLEVGTVVTTKIPPPRTGNHFQDQWPVIVRLHALGLEHKI